MRTGTELSISGEATRVVPPEETPPSSPPPVAPHAPARAGPGLATKFSVAAALLVLLTLGGAVAVATWRANEVAEKSIRESLAALPGIFRAYQGSNEDALRRQVTSVADEPGTKALFDAKDPKTLHDWTTDKSRAGKLDAGAVFLFDERGVLLDRSDQDAGEENRRSFASVKWVADALKGVPSTAVIRERAKLSYVASVPVLAGDPSVGEGRLVGILAAAVPLDAARAQTLQGITKGQAGFVANVAKRGEPPSLEVSASTEGFRGDALGPALAADRSAVDALFRQGHPVGPLEVRVAGDRRVVAAVPIKSATDETLGAFVVSRSRDEETAAFRRIRDTLLLVGGLALLLALPISFAMGRRIARPLAQLAGGAAEIREGNLDVTLPEAGGDEVGALSRAFRALLGELKEKAALEQMLAEMRRPDASVTRSTGLPSPAAPDAAARAFAGPRVGTLFAGRYQILGTLGKGGMGTVYRALDRELDDEVAVKVLLPEAFDEGNTIGVTLKQEIRLARKITHRNVVRTHDLGEADGLRFLTMEYVPGTTLRDILDRKGSIALSPGLQIAKQLCRGLAAVHEAGIIHRDIKPPNIMVLPNGLVKLMDFGIARTTEGADTAAQGDRTVGTPFYMSPEQAIGHPLDARSDLYSVGVVLYELFSGKRPVEGRNPGEVLRRHVSFEPTPIAMLRPDLPDLLARVLMQCLAKNPAQRPPTANDLYGALQRVAA
ncbi:MAG TPA: protein kinase [Thermoanaerobaculia bacterium]|nr:protein kinase [Thermoanaerobaculia bacterium]